MLDHEIIIVGAGFSGIGLGMSLRRRGLDDFVVLDAANDVGGVWHHNRYPGVAVDIPSTTYSFASMPNPDWSKLFAPGEELQAYARRCVEDHDLERHLRLSTRVEGADYDGTTHVWTVQTSAGPLRCRFLVSAIGPLDQPKWPDIPGLESFEGQIVHTARWDPDTRLEGVRVGIIGTGATSLQLTPEVAEVASHLDVFQRTPIWVIPKPNSDVPAWARRLFRRIPPTQRAVRLVSSAVAEFIMTAGAVYHTRVPFVIRWVERECLKYLEKSVDDPVTREKLTPHYAFACKRPSFSSTFLQTFNRDNVDLVTESIVRVEPRGLVTATTDPATGAVTEQLHELDTLLLATGFKVMQLGAVPAFPVRGPEGVEIGEHWDQHRYENYEGISTPLAPNFWLMNGPWAVAGPSWFSVIESGSRHIVRSLTEARRRGATQMVVRPAAHDRYMRSMRKKAQHTAFVQPSCSTANSYYFDRHGDAPFVRPVSGPALKWASGHFDLDDYEYAQVAQDDRAPEAALGRS